MNLLKKLGRFFLVLTEEERYIDPEGIKAVLIVNAGEGHYEEALKAACKRFQRAEIKTISNSKITALITDIHELMGEQFSVVTVLSLNPLVTFYLVLHFSCYFLIYNKFNQWFLIRRKTLYEFLAGRRGADKQEMDWSVAPARLNFAKCLAAILILPFVFTRNAFRLIKLAVYIVVNVLRLFVKRYCYKIKEYV